VEDVKRKFNMILVDFRVSMLIAMASAAGLA